jgi:hypothetical protein
MNQEDCEGYRKQNRIYFKTFAEKDAEINLLKLKINKLKKEGKK